MKLIRELRIGPPKSYKTGAVVGTYPKPMLVFLWDKDGLDIIPSVKQPPNQKGLIDVDIIYSDMVECKNANDLVAYCKLPQDKLPKVLYIPFYKLNKLQMTEEFNPFATSAAYQDFVNAVNYLATFGCPWKTYVMDSTTSLCDAMMMSISNTDKKMLSDARKWSPAVGAKVLQHIGVLNNMSCHTVFIAHSHMEKDETTGAISIVPLGPNRFAEQVGSIVSQYLYATTESGEAKVLTRPKGSVKAIGCRWPSGLPEVCGADFKSIYGKEIQ